MLDVPANDDLSLTLLRKIFLVGLILQLVSFFFFTTLLLSWVRKVKHHEPEIWRKDAGKPWYLDWRALFGALLISCGGILVRNICSMLAA